MINNKVRLHGGLERYADSEKSVTVKLPIGATLMDLLTLLSLPPALPKTVFVDKELKRLDSVLADGAQVRIFPPISGGAQKGCHFTPKE